MSSDIVQTPAHFEISGHVGGHSPFLGSPTILEGFQSFCGWSCILISSDSLQVPAILGFPNILGVPDHFRGPRQFGKSKMAGDLKNG